MKKTTVLVMLAIVLTVATTGCKPYPPPLGNNFVDEDVWGAKVVRVSECWRGKHQKHVCRIETDDRRVVYRDLKNWPGRWISVGDKLGTKYRVGQHGVEVWRIRTGSKNMSWMYYCDKSDPDCKWPSKGKVRPN